MCFCICALSSQASESPFVNGTVTYNLTVSPTGNLTVNCTVSNELGSYTKSVDISTCKCSFVPQHYGCVKKKERERICHNRIKKRRNDRFLIPGNKNSSFLFYFYLTVSQKFLHALRFSKFSMVLNF